MKYWQDLRSIIVGDASKFSLSVRLIIASVFFAILIVILWLTPVFFKWLKGRVTVFGKKFIPTLTIRKYKLLETTQVLNVLYTVLNILKWATMFLELFIAVPLIFSLFELTQDLAARLFGYVLTPLSRVLYGIIDYIPNLITIVIFIFIARYAVRSLKFFATRVERGKLVIPGFYAEWAQPTFNILRFIIYAFTIAVIYPYLPGSDSRAFQGVSVFVGIVLSLGSSSAIGNLVAGIVLTYMRPFTIGDRIQIQGVTGFVVEKSPIVTRIKTHKNEYVTFPNMMVLSSSITNYHTSTTEDEQGLILNAEITFGYGTPWQKVHELLIEGALKTGSILEDPKPFVLQLSLEDFYARYQINAYTKDVERVPAIYSELFENIQNSFRDAGLDMTASHFRINLPPESAKYSPQKKDAGASPPAGKSFNR
ncbi:MAG: mechanosensitive ion channel family protein [Treponema sp.]|jgi:small-conductance mechanosensitive channel|nr:mechanosensitive ion channel family protein [Treponema sp.]